MWRNVGIVLWLIAMAILVKATRQSPLLTGGSTADTWLRAAPLPEPWMSEKHRPWVEASNRWFGILEDR